jgi:hexosaminidase
MRPTTLLLCLVFSQPLLGANKPNPLIPAPQQIRYGTGRLPIAGVEIGFASSPTPQDRFAAEELASGLLSRAQVTVHVSDGEARHPAIILKRTGSGPDLPQPNEQAGPDSREAYVLSVTPEGAEIRANSSAGLFYGVQTLLQLVEETGAEAAIPEVEIHDWPGLPYRGIMVDMSHGPLPTEEEVKRQIDFLAHWKGNQYYFYSEASIEMKGYSVIEEDARFSQEEVRRIVSYARDRHVDLVPCMELYGHQHDLLRVERYADLGALRYGSEFNPRNPEVATLLSVWVEQLADIFPSPFFHVGMDETWETAKTPIAKEVSPDQLYLEQLQKVTELVHQHGKTMLIWSDMLSKYPKLLTRIPAGTIVVPWGYDATVYEPYWKPFASLPIPKMIATGVSIWNSIAPDFDVTFSNIDNFLAAGRPHGILGVMNTLWTDDALVLFRPSFPGIAYGAAASWQQNPMDRAQFFDGYARVVYPTPVADEVALGLKALTRSETHLAEATGDGVDTMRHLWDYPFARSYLARIRDRREDLHQSRLEAETAQEHFARALRLGGDHITLADFLLEARMLDYAGMRNLYALQFADIWQQLGSHPKAEDVDFYLSGEFASHDHSRLADLMDSIADLREGYRQAWDEAYTPYRRASVLSRFDAEFQQWWSWTHRLNRFAGNFHDGDTLPPLDSFFAGP